MPTQDQINEFKVKIAYGFTQYSLKLSNTFNIRGDRDLACEKNKHKLLYICKDAIFRYFDNIEDTTEMLSLVEIENIIEHFNRIAGTNYYIKLS